VRFRYSRWDGSQRLDDLDADDVLGAMADDLMAGADPTLALRRLLQQGLRDPAGARRPGLQDLLQRLRRERQARLNRYDLGSSLDDVARKVEEVLRTERAGLERRLEEARRSPEVSEAARRALEAQAAERQAALDRLPPDAAGRIRHLQHYDFVEPEARRLFDELMQSLRQQMLQPMLAGMKSALEGMGPEDVRRLREMLQDLNRMLRDRAEGREPDFQAFKAKWGQHFPGVASLDQLLEQMQRQMARMQSLMQSLSPEQRGQLEDMMRSLMLRDERLEAAMAQLAMNLEALMPADGMGRRYPFRGDEDLSLQEAMGLMDELHQLDALERALKGAHGPGDLDRLNAEQIERLLGEEAARELQDLKAMARRLEEAGYLERDGDRLRLTARAIRKIGDKALRDVFAHLTRDRFGRHVVDRRGAGGDPTDESKPYEFGDPFLLDLRETVMRAVARGGRGIPVRLAPDDFQVHRTELSTQAATVVMLDLSRSMLNNGYFLPAKKVALALHSLISGQFPRDTLHIVGFSLYASEIAPADLPRLSIGDSGIGTNMHAGFALARRLLGRARGANKQILMVTDGEPTAHLEDGEADFAYPPSYRTVQETLREVQRCTREGITINTFMLEQNSSLAAFVEQMARINRGRAFFATADRLGEYLLVDYVTTRRKSIV
jgi:uncharacterized protein with von Willebrand factor type A (vWA) domain